MGIYRKKPVVIEAHQLGGSNGYALADWCAGSWSAQRGVLHIETLEGEMTAQIGDWIIEGVQGEFYPCRDSIFRETYEEAKLLWGGTKKGVTPRKAVSTPREASLSPARTGALTVTTWDTTALKPVRPS